MTTAKGGKPLTYKPENAVQAAKLCNLGATDAELADFFEVSRSTISRWKHDHPEFAEALKIGKELADDRVERSLYQRAVGYEQEEVKIFMPTGSKEPVYAPFVARIPGDVTACIFWLKNRRGWRDKQEMEHFGQMTVNFSGADAEL